MLARIKQLMDHTWFVAGLSAVLMVIIAAPLSYLVLWLWDEWTAPMALLYGFLFIGGGWLLTPSRSLIGNAITIGIFFGLVFIPFVVWVSQGP